MIRLSACITLCLVSVATVTWSVAVADTEQQDSFEPLFNGTDLNNWVCTNTPQETWTPQNGILICSGEPYGEIRTKEMFQNFILEVEWRHLVPKGNAGIFIWADDLPARGVPFHRGIEVQVLEVAAGNSQFHTSHGDIFPIHGAIMVPDNGRGGSRAFPTEWRARPAPEWNHFRITGLDGTITLAVNGRVVTSGHNCSPRKGYICLESEGGVVHYRNMRIKRLPDTTIADEHTAIADRGYRTVYNGLTLSGWRTDRRLQDHVAEADGWMASDWKLKHRGTGPGKRLICDLSGQLAFICDFRQLSPTATARFFLVGEDHPTGILDLTHPEVAGQLVRPGSFNRLEYENMQDRLVIRLNGTKIRQIDLVDADRNQTTLIVEASGSMDFANLFSRPGLQPVDQSPGESR